MTSSPEAGPDSGALRARLALAREAAVAAARLLARFHGRLQSVEHKGAIDLVTEADRGSEALIVAALADAFPHDQVIGEEGAARGAADAEWCWYIDPLDGTTNYVSGLPHFAVSIGASWRGLPALGVVLAPALGQLWIGAHGLGAERVDLVPWTLAETAAPPRRLSASGADRLDAVLAATGFPYKRVDILDTLLPAVGRALTHCRGVRRLGSASLDLVLVAEGVFGVFWERRLEPWDLLAGVVIVREAGGIVTDLAGGDAVLAGHILAAGPRLHALALRDIVGEA